jgi:hypothetical protein
VKAALQEANRMLGSNTENGDMIIERLVIILKAFRLFVRSGEPVVKLVQL